MTDEQEAALKKLLHIVRSEGMLDGVFDLVRDKGILYARAKVKIDAAILACEKAGL